MKLSIVERYHDCIQKEMRLTAALINLRQESRRSCCALSASILLGRTALRSLDDS